MHESTAATQKRELSPLRRLAPAFAAVPLTTAMPSIGHPPGRTTLNSERSGAQRHYDADVTADGSPTVHARAAQLELSKPGTTYSDVDINCSDLLIKQPQFACNQGSIAARGGPTGQIAMNAAAAYDTSNEAVSVSGSGLKVAEP